MGHGNHGNHNSPFGRMLTKADQILAQKQQIEQIRRKTEHGIETGELTARDRFDNPLPAGSLVQWRTPTDMIWLVEAVELPPLDYWQPGTFQLKLTCTVPAVLIPNQPNQGFTLVGRQQDSRGAHQELTSPAALGEVGETARVEANRTPSGLILGHGALDEIARAAETDAARDAQGAAEAPAPKFPPPFPHDGTTGGDDDGGPGSQDD